MKKLLGILIIGLITILSPCLWADDKCITVKEFLREFNTIPLVDWSDIEYTLYCRTSMEFIDGEWVLTQECITLKELGERLCE